MSRISDVFRSLSGEGALIAYVMGGDPEIRTTGRIVDAVVAGGADIVELGIPFSDPIADGRSIQAAGARALSAGTRPSDVLSLASDIGRRHHIPVAIMTYYNVLYSRGLERFLDEAKSASIDGLIVPDLPFDETASYCRLAQLRGLDTILLTSPNTSRERMKSLVRRSSGFLYLVSLLGVTGARSSLGGGTLGLIGTTKAETEGRIPLAVGFGISKPDHVRRVIEAGADGVIVGSGIVDRIASQTTRMEMLRDVEGYVRSLKRATRAPTLA